MKRGLLNVHSVKKTYKNSIGLTNHKLNHTREKTLSCKICDRAFSRSRMKYHMMAHSGEKPHICEHCKTTSREVHNLKKTHGYSH